MSKDVLFYFFFPEIQNPSTESIGVNSVFYYFFFFVAGKGGTEVTSTSPNKGTFSFCIYRCCNHQGFIFWPKENFIFLSKTKQEIPSWQDYTVQVGI